jgi:hypothetical protein
MLLEEDGLDEEWEAGVQSEWEGDWGLHDIEDAETFGVSRDFDSSVLGGGIEKTNELAQVALVPRLVRHMKLTDFRRRLIEHFSCMWRQHRVTWPSRNGEAEWTPSPALLQAAGEFGVGHP